MSIGGHHSQKAGKDEWLTPPEIIHSLGDFDLDPCSPVNRPWDTAKNHLTILDDGFNQPWEGRVWCNPPYGRETGRWLAKCAEHGNATALVFARTETSDWVKHIWGRAHAIMFLFGRIYFYHVTGQRASANSGGPSALISYDASNTEKLLSCSMAGQVVLLREEGA